MNFIRGVKKGCKAFGLALFFLDPRTKKPYMLPGFAGIANGF